MRNPTYKQRREGKAGINAHMTRLVNAAHSASVNPMKAMKTRGLQDAIAHKRALKRKKLLKNRKRHE